MRQVEDPSKYGVVVTDESGKVERFVEKPKVRAPDQAPCQAPERAQPCALRTLAPADAVVHARMHGRAPTRVHASRARASLSPERCQSAALFREGQPVPGLKQVLLAPMPALRLHAWWILTHWGEHLPSRLGVGGVGIPRE